MSLFRRPLGLEQLEDRLAPAMFLVTTATDNASVPAAFAGTGTLRQAIIDAAATAGADTIVFADSLAGQTIHLTLGDPSSSVGPTALVIGDDVTIDGAAAPNLSISGDDARRDFAVAATGTLTLKNLTLTGGKAVAAGPGAMGGAIYNDGTLNLEQTTVTGNRAVGAPGPGPGSPGGDALGGAIFNNGGTVHIVNSTLTGNTAQGGPGGGPTPGPPGRGLGGAIANRNGTLSLLNDTLSGNSALDGAGAAILAGGRDVFNLGDAGTATADITNTILGQADTLAQDFTGLAVNGGTSSSSGDRNLVRMQSGFGGSVASTADPQLGALADNGGPTQTMAPAPTSPAINTGNTIAAGDLPTDQRGPGFDRVHGKAVDIGAFESDNDFALTITPDAIATNASPITFTFTFATAPTSFSPNNVMITNGTPGLLSGSGTKYLLDVFPGADGTVEVSVAAGAVQDAVGNLNLAAAASVLSDRTAPTVKITPSGIVTNASPIVFTFTFSEPVNGFDAGDVKISNGSPGTFKQLNGTTYTEVVTPVTQAPVTVSVADNAAMDPAGNGNLAASATTQTAGGRFVQALYRDELGRSGSLAELDAWVAVLNSAGQQAVADGIENSLEACDRRVRGWYAAYLGRQAQGGEELGWVALLQATHSEELVQSGLLGSTEFFNRAQGMGFGGTPAENCIQALYRVLLGRAGSPAEVAGWLGAFPQLVSRDAELSAAARQQVALGFLSSQEYRTNQVAGYYHDLLHRPYDLGGLDGWVFSGLGLHDIRLGFYASAEFFTNG